jgi:NAD(P)-dependent dehydrogenase (short-subunit alcohol dehydrogenase family)
MKVDGANVLVTGANRGIGRHLTQAFKEAGAAKVYAGARDSATIDDPDLIAVRLDVTDEARVNQVAKELSDVSIVINNAGVGTAHPLLADGVLEAARNEMEVNYIGSLSVSKAFAPVLAANGGGALANVLSVVSWIAMPDLATYSASKSAAWSLTNALRIHLRAQGTLVTGFHFGFVDTDLTAGIDLAKHEPRFIADAMVDAIRNDREEVAIDELSQNVKAALGDDQGLLYPGIQANYDAQTFSD